MESAYTFDLPERVVERINSIKPQKIFVSKDCKDTDYLPRALKNLGFDVQAQSLIEFKQVKMYVMPHSDWIFFSSKRAVK